MSKGLKILMLFKTWIMDHGSQGAQIWRVCCSKQSSAGPAAGKGVGREAAWEVAWAAVQAA